MGFMEIIVVLLVLYVCNRLSEALPTGFLFSLAMWLLTVLAAFIGLAAVLFIKGSLPHPYVMNGEIIIKEMQNFFLALIASPFVVWFYRNRRRAKAAAPTADGGSASSGGTERRRAGRPPVR